MNETKNDTFRTETGVQTKNILYFTLTGLVLLALALFALKISAALYAVIAVCIFTSVLMLIVLQVSTRWTITFEGSRLYVHNSHSGMLRASYDCGEIRYSQLKLIQTSAAKDTGYMEIPGTIHKYGNIKDFSKLCAYLEANLEP